MSRGVRRNALVEASERLPKRVTPGCEGCELRIYYAKITVS